MLPVGLPLPKGLLYSTGEMRAVQVLKAPTSIAMKPPRPAMPEAWAGARGENMGGNRQKYAWQRMRPDLEL